MVQMDERKARVLRATVDDYVATAEPVGSRTLARRYHFGFSPATIRNEMADLEELGYLEQPHTSAGRIPSNRGYRYYVDCLMEATTLSDADQARIEAAFRRRIGEIDTLMQQTAKLIAETTSYPAMVMAPAFERSHFHRLQMVPLDGERALLVLVTDQGVVENEIIEMPSPMTLTEIQHFCRAVSERLRGEELERLSPSALRDLQRDLPRYRTLLEQTLEFLTQGPLGGEGERVYLGGATKIMGQPEFRDVNKVKGLLEALEQEQVVHDILMEAGSRGEDSVVVQIGEEIRIKEMQDCSVITATYRVGDRTMGRIGVLGPRRMEYARVVAVIEEVSRRLTDAFQRG